MNESDLFNNIEDPIQLVKAFAAHAPVGVQIYDAEGYTVYTNKQHHEIFGGPPPPDYCVLKDDHVKRNGNLHLVHQAFGGTPTIMPLFWYDPGELHGDGLSEESLGKKAAIETHMIPVFDKGGKVSHVMFIFRDVTAQFYWREERARAIKAQADAMTLIRAVLSQTPAVVFIKDTEGRNLFVNEQFCRAFNMSQDEVIGKRDAEFFPAEMANAFRKTDLHVMKAGSHFEFEEKAQHADGTVHEYLSSKFPIRDSEGNLIGVGGISTDISQFRSLERRLNRAQRMEAMGLLAGGIAHDFNNVLGTILLESDTMLMKGSKNQAEWRASVQAIKDAAQGAALLTRQLLAFGRRQSSEPSNVDVKRVLAKTHSILKKSLGEDIRFIVDVDSELWAVRIDPGHMEQILSNLCINARDAMPKGGTLRISARNAERSDGQFVFLEVADDGEGIDPKLLDRIFEPFFTTKGGGHRVGLGLATVYGIVQGARAEISVESKLDRGTAFRIYFPRAPGAAAKDMEGGETHVAGGGRETILLVEDRTALRKVTAKLLRDQGYTVVESRSGKAALAAWKKHAKAIDLVMTDIVMPGINGIELVRRMKRKRPLKTLFVSAYSERQPPSDQDHLQFLEKPYTANELLSKLRQVLGS